MSSNKSSASRVEYYAGFFDGEGSIGIYRNGTGLHHLRTQITQNVSDATTELFKELKEAYGGNLGIMRSSIYRNNEAYNWQLNGEGAKNFLMDLLPHLRLKRTQALVACAWQMALHQPSQRNALGRMVAAARNRPEDLMAEAVMKALKKG